jgi:hypothetical protein
LSWQYGTIIVHALEFTKWATWTKFQQAQHLVAVGEGELVEGGHRRRPSNQAPSSSPGREATHRSRPRRGKRRLPALDPANLRRNGGAEGWRRQHRGGGSGGGGGVWDGGGGGGSGAWDGGGGAEVEAAVELEMEEATRRRRRWWSSGWRRRRGGAGGGGARDGGGGAEVEVAAQSSGWSLGEVEASTRGVGTKGGGPLEVEEMQRGEIPPGMRDGGGLRANCRTRCRHRWRRNSGVF